MKFRYIIYGLLGCLISCSEHKESEANASKNKSSVPTTPTSGVLSASEHEAYFTDEDEILVSLYDGKPVYPRVGTAKTMSEGGTMSTSPQNVILTYIILEEELPEFKKYLGDYDIKKLTSPFVKNLKSTRLTSWGAYEAINYPIESEVLVIEATKDPRFANLKVDDVQSKAPVVLKKSLYYGYYLQSIKEHFTKHPNTSVDDFNKQSKWHSYVALSPSFFGSTNLDNDWKYNDFIKFINSTPTASNKVSEGEVKPTLLIDDVIGDYVKENISNDRALGGMVMTRKIGMDARETSMALPLAMVSVASAYHSFISDYVKMDKTLNLINNVLTSDDDGLLSCEATGKSIEKYWNKETKTLIWTEKNPAGIEVTKTEKLEMASFDDVFSKRVDDIVKHEIGHVFSRRTYLKDSKGVSYDASKEDESPTAQLYSHCSDQQCYMYMPGLVENEKLKYKKVIDDGVGECSGRQDRIFFVNDLDNASINELNEYKKDRKHFCYQHYLTGPIFYLNDEIQWSGATSLKQEGAE